MQIHIYIYTHTHTPSSFARSTRSWSHFEKQFPWGSIAPLQKTLNLWLEGLLAAIPAQLLWLTSVDHLATKAFKTSKQNGAGHLWWRATRQDLDHEAWKTGFSWCPTCWLRQVLRLVEVDSLRKSLGCQIQSVFARPWIQRYCVPVSKHIEKQKCKAHCECVCYSFQSFRFLISSNLVVFLGGGSVRSINFFQRGSPVLTIIVLIQTWYITNRDQPQAAKIPLFTRLGCWSGFLADKLVTCCLPMGWSSSEGDSEWCRSAWCTGEEELYAGTLHESPWMSELNHYN